MYDDNHRMELPSRMVDLRGKSFGRWIVLSYAGRSRTGARYWNCICKCGITKRVSGSNLVQGQTLSCGCLKVEKTRESHKTHGQASRKSVSTEYRIWAGMLSRCRNPNAAAFSRYGGRGIKVAKRWMSFTSFFNDMGARPRGRTLERRDNDGDYCKRNCYWATYKQQNNNRSNNRILLSFGVQQTVSQWSLPTKILSGTLISRLRRGWSAERTLTEPVQTKFRNGNAKR